MSQEPTPSKATNRLIAMATKVAEGAAQPESYYPLLAETLQHSIANREVTEARAQDRGELFLAEHGELLDQVLDHMEAYEAGLMRHTEYFETGNPQSLLDGNQMLVEAITPLLEALDLYGGAFLTFGPADYPLMNSVLNTLNWIIKGNSPPEALEQVKKSAIEYHELGIAQMEASEEANTDGYEIKKKAYEDIVRALKELEPVSEESLIEEAVRPLHLALEALTQADQKILIEGTSLTPTNMPSANILISAIRGGVEGHLSRETVAEAMAWYRSFTEQIEEQFDLAMEAETNSLVILEELPKTREIVDLHDEILERLETALSAETLEKEVIEEVIDEFVDVVDRLEASSEVFIEAAQREGKLICVKCGHANPPNNRVCESCGFKLPQLVDPTMYAQSTFEMEERTGLEEETDDDYHMGINTYRLFEAAYNFYEGNIEEAEFRTHINTSRRTVEESEDGLHNMTGKVLTEKQLARLTPEDQKTFEESQEMFEEVRTLLEEGIDDWLEGLEYFEGYIETRHRPTLETGIQLIFVASQKIHKVTKLGEMANKTLDEITDKEKEKAQAGQAPPAPAAPAEVEAVEESTGIVDLGPDLG